MFTFKPDSSLSFADFLRLMYAVYAYDGGTVQLIRVEVNEQALRALPEEFRKYFTAGVT